MTSPPLRPLPPRSAMRAKSGKRSMGKIFVTLLLVLTIGIGLYVGYIYYKVNSAIQTVGTEDSVLPEQSANVKPLTIVLLGKDTRKETGSLNTDVIMVASLNPQTKSATIVSIPRDTLVKASGYRSAKANSYYANFYMSDKKSMDRQIKQLFSKYLDIPIDYVSIIDFKGFEDLIDHLGGLSINVDMDMCYRDTSDGTNIKLKKGLQVLDGKNTLDFVRYRSSNCGGTADSNDIQRNERQQQVLQQMIGKMKSIGTVTKLGGMIESVGKNINTDIPSQQIKNLISTYIGIDRDNIKYIHLEGKWNSPYIYVSDAELKAARDALKQQLR